METRRFGRSGHLSTVAIFGGVSLLKLTQKEADEAMQKVIDAGINHIDVAPEYGLAQERLGPWMPRMRDRFFLGCKTMERTSQGAADELEDSLRKLRVDWFDLYQLHAVATFDELDRATAPGGALETIVDARQKGLTRYIGITTHGVKAPEILLEALRRFDFDSVLFPVNFIQYRDAHYRQKAQEVIQLCKARDVGIMAIKAVCKGPYDEKGKQFNTMYLPFTDMEHIQQGVNFSLSQDVSGLCSVGEVSLLPLFIQACQNYRLLTMQEQEDMIAAADVYTPYFKDTN